MGAVRGTPRGGPPRGWSIVGALSDRTGPAPEVTTTVIELVWCLVSWCNAPRVHGDPERESTGLWCCWDSTWRPMWALNCA
ncbi:hypothetical protein NDU88_004944 [Pleurodeles waltl]|uniref:Uncharacterized protein n=1 Tax=Pleurodeles waltl TaxID=8319 RepID=A0AAV7W6E8_PLEWA|nr:hypothetical protein NDU88_004944 [Pleurodeles waltl]